MSGTKVAQITRCTLSTLSCAPLQVRRSVVEGGGAGGHAIQAGRCTYSWLSTHPSVGMCEMLLSLASASHLCARRHVHGLRTWRPLVAFGCLVS